MSRVLAPLGIAALVAVAGAVVAAERAAAAAVEREARLEAERDLREALALAEQHPGAFGHPPVPDGGAGLKSLVQEAANRHKLALGFLSESERDADGGRRERQALLRFGRAGHGALVRCLGELEVRGGLRIREIRVRPSLDEPDAYDEAEIVLVRGVDPRETGP